MNAQIICDGTPGRNVAFILQAQDPSGGAHPGTGTAAIDDYDSAFLVSIGSNAFQILPKITLPVGAPTQTVTATFQVDDTASGQPLYPDPLEISVDLVAPPPAPGQLATNLVITGQPTPGTGSTASDPGSATISVSLS